MVPAWRTHDHLYWIRRGTTAIVQAAALIFASEGVVTQRCQEDVVAG